MTIYWFGGEDIDFPNPSISGSTNLSTMIRNAYARSGVIPSSSSTKGNYTDPLGAGGLISGEIWLAACMYNYSGSGTSYDGVLSLVSGEDLFDGWGIGRSNNYLALGKWTAGVFSWVASSTEDVHIPGGSVDKFRMYINYAESGEIRLYRNEILAYTYSGEVLLDGVNGFNLLQISGDTNYSVFSELILCTDDPYFKAVKYLTPNAAGDTNQWHGAYTDIDESTYSESDFVYSDGSGETFLCNLTGMPVGAWNVEGVRVAARVLPVPTGRGVKLGVKTGGSSFSGEIYSNPGRKTIEKTYLVNPNTSSVWTSGEVDALQFLLKTEAV